MIDGWIGWNLLHANSSMYLIGCIKIAWLKFEINGCKFVILKGICEISYCKHVILSFSSSWLGHFFHYFKKYNLDEKISSLFWWMLWMKILFLKIEGLHLRLYFGSKNLEIVVKVDGPFFWANGWWFMSLLHYFYWFCCLQTNEI